MHTVLEIEEIIARFREEYVLIDMCRFNDGCQVTHGRIVATSSNRDDVYRQLRQTPNSVIIFAGPDAMEHEGAFLDEGRAFKTHLVT